MDQHLRHFPNGQFVIQDDRGILRATSSTMRVNRERALAPHTWLEITGMGTLRTHEPGGEILYGVNIAVDPSFQGRGLGRTLYDSRFGLARSLGCTAFAAGARIPGFHRVAGWCTPEDYIRKVVAGELRDPTLSKQLALGFQVAGVLLDYAYDHETLGHAALIVKNL
ncbi:MAG: GNAT family N-acetyltransferase [Acidobacteria bacterium]|nr:GNAT family N-acetyltransferase [Acidobacteriota bacterium]